VFAAIEGFVFALSSNDQDQTLRFYNVTCWTLLPMRYVVTKCGNHSRIRVYWPNYVSTANCRNVIMFSTKCNAIYVLGFKPREEIAVI
jgi:hypothetical protein